MIIAPSILSLNYDNFNEELSKLNESVEWLHFDVMDGHFVPNITFGPDILKAFRRNTSLFLDVHLMIDNPELFIESFAKAGADAITFHYEVYNDLNKCEKLIDIIHENYLKAGISVKPNTDIETIYPLLNKLDQVLVMSVEPGFGGQEFMPSALTKIKKLDDYRKQNNLNYLILDDGGVNDRNAFEIIQNGCDVLIAGSFIFKGDIKNNVQLLRKMII